MNKNIRRTITILLTLVLLFGLSKFFLSELESYRSQQDYEQASDLAGNTTAESTSDTSPDFEVNSDLSSEDPVIQELLEIDLNALREENEDVIGWIYIPGSKINYPLLQWTDNEFYLNHTWKQSKNSSGSIFMECQNSPDFSDFNTIIYGHNMRTGEMFGTLHYYHIDGHQEKHPYIYIVNDEYVLRYDIFAAQSADTKSIIYGLGLDSDQRKKEFIRYAQDYSFFETDITPTPSDHILTLSTCTVGAQKRWVVLGVLNEDCSYKRSVSIS